jgi:hypothetical protein
MIDSEPSASCSVTSPAVSGMITKSARTPLLTPRMHDHHMTSEVNPALRSIELIALDRCICHHACVVSHSSSSRMY